MDVWCHALLADLRLCRDQMCRRVKSDESKWACMASPTSLPPLQLSVAKDRNSSIYQQFLHMTGSQACRQP